MEKKPFQLLAIPNPSLKDGHEFMDYIQTCWLFLPDVLELMPDEFLLNYSQQVVDCIQKYSENHMLSFTTEEAYEHMFNRKALVLVDPEKREVLGFAKLYAWNDKQGHTVGWEFGSLFINPALRNHHLAQLLTEQLVNYRQKEMKKDEKQIPIFAVVTVDNLTSLKLFKRMNWKELHPSAEETFNFNFFNINGVNIYEDWGKDSIIFFY